MNGTASGSGIQPIMTSTEKHHHLGVSGGARVAFGPVHIGEKLNLVNAGVTVTF